MKKTMSGFLVLKKVFDSFLGKDVYRRLIYIPNQKLFIERSSRKDLYTYQIGGPPGRRLRSIKVSGGMVQDALAVIRAEEQLNSHLNEFVVLAANKTVPRKKDGVLST